MEALDFFDVGANKYEESQSQEKHLGIQKWTRSSADAETVRHVSRWKALKC